MRLLTCSGCMHVWKASCNWMQGEHDFLAIIHMCLCLCLYTVCLTAVASMWMIAFLASGSAWTLACHSLPTPAYLAPACSQVDTVVSKLEKIANNPISEVSLLLGVAAPQQATFFMTYVLLNIGAKVGL